MTVRTSGQTADSGSEILAPASVTTVRPGGWRALFLLIVVYILSFLDRTILSSLGEPIKRSLDLTDAQLGLLGGFAFALTYAVLGLPFAALSERLPRKLVIVAALVIWSSMTALSSLAGGFLTLLVLRAGVGIGEAGFTAPAHSMISDFFPRERRTVALALFNSATPIGVFIAAVGGGWLAQTLGWRTSFFILGLPGLLLAPLFLSLVREPTRGEADGIPATQIFGFGVIARTLLGSRAGLFTMIGCSFGAMASYSIMAFTVSFLMRRHGLPAGEAATIFGTCLCIGQLIATIGGGLLIQHLTRRNMRWLLLTPAIAMLAMAGIQAIAWSQPLGVFLPLFTLTLLLGSVYVSPCFAVVHALLPARMRAGGMSIVLLCNALVGLGLGPPLAGALSDRFAAAAYGHGFAEQCSGPGNALVVACAHAAASGIERALATASVIALVASAALFFAASGLRADLARAEARQLKTLEDGHGR